MPMSLAPLGSPPPLPLPPPPVVSLAREVVELARLFALSLCDDASCWYSRRCLFDPEKTREVQADARVEMGGGLTLTGSRCKEQRDGARGPMPFFLSLSPPLLQSISLLRMTPHQRSNRAFPAPTPCTPAAAHGIRASITIETPYAHTFSLSTTRRRRSACDPRGEEQAATGQQKREMDRSTRKEENRSGRRQKQTLVHVWRAFCPRHLNWSTRTISDRGHEI